MRAVVGALICAVAVAACDSTPEKQTPCEAGLCSSPSSTFAQEDQFARQIEGRILRGTEVVPGALLQLEPAPGLAWDERLRNTAAGDPSLGNRSEYITSSDLGGKYHITNGPFFYDLSIRKDREVAVFRTLGARYFEPPLGADAPVSGFTATVAAATDLPVEAGNLVAFFVGGAEARTARGDGSSLVVMFRHFEALVTMTAVEYVASGGLAAATRAGRVDVHLTNGGAASTIVPMKAIEAVAVNDIKFVALPPAGYALSMLDVVMDLGVRTSARPVARIAAGSTLHLAIVPGARYFVRATATHAGAIADSGLQPFDPFQDAVAVTLPPPITDATFDGINGFSAVAAPTACDAANALAKAQDPKAAAVPCVSLIEHVLVPSAIGTSFRVVTTDRAASLPDLTRIGVPRPAGPYSWTVQQFPTLKRTDNLSGEDIRVFVPVSITAPRVIDLH
jgi:hypothetical protein